MKTQLIIFIVCVVVSSTFVTRVVGQQVAKKSATGSSLAKPEEILIEKVGGKKTRVKDSTAVIYTMLVDANKWNGDRSKQVCTNVSAPGNKLYVTENPIWFDKNCGGGNDNACSWAFHISKQTDDQVCAITECNNNTVENCEGAVIVKIAEVGSNPPVAGHKVFPVDVAISVSTENPREHLCAIPDFNGQLIRPEYTRMITTDPENCSYSATPSVSSQGIPCADFYVGTPATTPHCSARGLIYVTTYPQQPAPLSISKKK